MEGIRGGSYDKVDRSVRNLRKEIEGVAEIRTPEGRLVERFLGKTQGTYSS
jgi:hypothetical protein